MPPSYVDSDPWRGPLHAICGLAFLAVVSLLAVSWRQDAGRGERGNAADRQWSMAALGGFALALVVRLLLVPQLSNWQAQVLPSTGGAGWERYGPGTFVFQAVLRALFPWTDTTLFVANALVGAAVILPYTAILRELGFDAVDAAAAILLLALSPTHARTSASASEHVLSSTLTVVAVWGWLRGFSKGVVVTRLLALACVPAVALIRVDAWPQLAMIPLGAALAGPPSATPRRAPGWTAAFAIVWLLTAAILRPALGHHPTPGWWNFVGAVVGLIPNFFIAAFRPPFWMPPLGLVLAVIGAVALYRANRGVLAWVVAALVLVFVPIGRGAVYNFLESRYVLVSFCIVGVLSSAGFAAARRSIAARVGPPWSNAYVLLVALGLITAAFAVPAMTATFTFQDEYAFLRHSLRALPDDCVVFSIPARDNRIERDVDTGLDLPNSPLVLAYPRLQFRELADGLPQVTADQCVAYYESALCSIEETAAVKRRFPEAYEVIRGRCGEVRSAGSLEVVAEASVSPLSVNDLFGGHTPKVRLSRWYVGGR